MTYSPNRYGTVWGIDVRPTTPSAGAYNWAVGPFYCDEDGTVTSVAQWYQYEASNYFQGDGGNYTYQAVPDNGSFEPDEGTVLSTWTVNTPPGTFGGVVYLGYVNVPDFAVTAGTYYWILGKNVHSNPGGNWTSHNGITYGMRDGSLHMPMQWKRPAGSWQLTPHNRGGNIEGEGFVAIAAFQYTNGRGFGQAMIGNDFEATPNYFGSNGQLIRERFTPTYDFTYNGLNVLHHWVSGSTTVTMNLYEDDVLVHSDAANVDEIIETNFPWQINYVNGVPVLPGSIGLWRHPVSGTLTTGSEYRMEFTSSGLLVAMNNRESGAMVGPAPVYDEGDGYAEWYNGSTWVGQEGGRTDMHLNFYFEGSTALTITAATEIPTPTVTTGSEPEGGDGYYQFNGFNTESLSSPDSAILSVTGDYELRALLAPDQWNPGFYEAIVSKWNFGGGQRSYWLMLNQFVANINSEFALAVGDGGNNRVVDVTGVYANGEKKWIRVAVKPSLGTGSVYVAPDSGGYGTSPSGVVTIDGVQANPGENIQNAVNAISVGQSVYLADGIYENQSFTIPAGKTVRPLGVGTRWWDTSAGTGVLISGGSQVTGWTVDGANWWADISALGISRNNDTTENYLISDRDGDQITCTLDNGWLHHVSGTGNLQDTPRTGATGNYFVDYGTNRLYVGIDPTSSTVLLARQGQVVRVDGVLQDVTVAHSRVPKQTPMIAVYDGGVCDRVEMWAAHGVAVKYMDGAVNAHVRNGWLHHIGQLGAACDHESGITTQQRNDGIGNTNQCSLVNNRFEYCNMNFYKPGFEAGAAKIAWSDGFLIEYNHARFIYGMGLWTDINNYNSIHRYNLTEDTWGPGIYHEVSFLGYIGYNKVLRAGAWPTRTVSNLSTNPENFPDQPTGGSGWNSHPGIHWAESNPSFNRFLSKGGGGGGTGIIEHNHVEDCRGGIFFRQINRDCDGSYPGSQGYHNKNVIVRNNDVWWDANIGTWPGAAGAPRHGTGNSHDSSNCNVDSYPFSSQSGIVFQDNDYTINGTYSVPSNKFFWNSDMNFATWQGLGHDTTNAGADAPPNGYGITADNPLIGGMGGSGGSWVLLGTDSFTATPSGVPDSTAAVYLGLLGADAVDPYNGKLYAVEIWDGIENQGGTRVANPDFRNTTQRTSTSPDVWTDTYGNVWTQNGGVSYVNPSGGTQTVAPITVMDLTAEVPAPSGSITPENIFLSIVDTTVEIPTPTVLTEVPITTSTVVANLEMPTPTVGLSHVATPTTTEAAGSLTAPTVVADALVSPAVIDVPYPGLQVSVNIDGDTQAPGRTIGASVSFAVPTVTGTATHAATPVIALTALPTPVIVVGVVFAPDPIEDRDRVSYAYFARIYHSGVPTLVLIPVGRGATTGVKSVEGFESVSDIFAYFTNTEDALMLEMAVPWAANKDADAAVLEAALELRLTSLGFRGPSGANLP